MNRKFNPRRTPIRVRIENSKPDARPGAFATLKEIAPVVTGFGTLLLSLASIYFVHTQDVQKNDLAVADIRAKALPAAAETDATKRDVGAMSIAIYGSTAAPAIRLLLSGSAQNRDIRDFGVLVVRHWLESADEKDRSEILSELSRDARSESANLREGAYAALAAISRVLSRQEDQRVLALLQDRFGGPNVEETSKDVAWAACPLLNKYGYPSVRAPLKAIAAAAPDQAVESYTAILVHSCKTEERQMMAQDLAADHSLDQFAARRERLIAQAQKVCSQCTDATCTP